MTEEKRDGLIEDKEGYWTPLEKYIRDWFFDRIRITRILGLVPHCANILTVSRFFITFWAVLDFLFYYNSIERQVWFLASAWSTDFLDGPTARNNKNVTAFGTIADHMADFILILWMLFLGFYITLDFNVVNPLEKFAIIMLYTVLSLTTMGIFLVAIGMWLFKREKRIERLNQLYIDFVKEFLLKDLVITFGARVHTWFTAFGIVFYLIGAIWKHNFYLYSGAALLIVQMVSMGFYLHEVFQARYEDRMYKIRRGLEKKIERLEEALKRRKGRE